MGADDARKLLELFDDEVDLLRRIGVEEDFGEQIVVFAQEAARDGHVLFKGRTGCVLRLHHAGEGEGRNERDGERIGDGLIVLDEGVVVDVELQAGIDLAEKCLAEGVALFDDDGVVLAQVAQIGERGAEHGVRRDVTVAGCGVELGQTGFDRCDVAQDAVFAQIGQHFVEDGQRILDGHAIDEQFGVVLADFVVGGESARVQTVSQLFGMAGIEGDIVLHTKGIGQEHAHLART